MPIRYVIDEKRRLVLSTGWDRLTFAETKAHQDQLVDDPDFNPEFDQLIDLTAVSALEMSTDEARVIASRVFFSPRSRRALVATLPYVYGMGRLMGAYDQIVRKHDDVGIFYDRDAALRWLVLDRPPHTI